MSNRTKTSFPSAAYRTVEAKQPDTREPKPLPAAAKRALAEAAERRKQMDSTPPLAKEIDGRKGPEPTRYGDWEKDGIISDF